jgi:hypothetical protein
MESGKQDRPKTIALNVIHLCDRYQRLNKRRLELDQRIMALPSGSPECDPLWQELDVALTEVNTLVAQLATMPAADQAGLRAKAAVLALLLRAPAANAATLGSETMALALSVADDVAGLV